MLGGSCRMLGLAKLLVLGGLLVGCLLGRRRRHLGVTFGGRLRLFVLVVLDLGFRFRHGFHFKLFLLLQGCRFVHHFRVLLITRHLVARRQRLSACRTRRSHHIIRLRRPDRNVLRFGFRFLRWRRGVRRRGSGVSIHKFEISFLAPVINQ